MFFRTSAVGLALLLPHEGCSGEPFPDATLVAVPSPNNNILYEQAIDGLSSEGLSWDDPATPIKIQSNVPLTVQRYDWSDVSTEINPLQADEGRILVTSNCNSGETTAIPNVQVRREGGEILIGAELTGVPADEASQMLFLQSSSYDAVYYEAGCGWIEGTASPAYVGITRPPQPTPSPVKAPASQTACLTESDCKAMQQRAGFASFHSGEYRTKGCFFKAGSGKAFWGQGGTAEEKSKASLPGLQKRLYCEGPEEVEPPKPPPPQAEGVCTTREQCDQKRLEMGIASFRAGAYPTKGCFAKGGNAYWGIGGSDEDRSKPDLPGQQARIFCNESEENERCEIGPMAKPGNPCTGGEFCLLDTGVCNNKSGIHVGTCEATPEECIEIFQPVCGCDGKTHSNSCKAHAQGVSISRPGQCQKTKIPCLTERECDKQRKQRGITSFYSGAFATKTKGCFLKGGKAFFAEGSEAAMSEATLPGAQERLWCNGNGASEIKSALQQENAATQLQPDRSASSACSLRPLMLGSFLYHITSAKADLVHSPRVLDTCTFNVEVLLSGCNDMGTAADIKLKAPKARSITSVTDLEQEVASKELDRVLEDGTHLYRADYRVSANVTFPDDQAVGIDSSVDSYSVVPPFDEWQCSVIVCGRPFSDSMGNSLLASSCSTDGTGKSSSWLGRTLTLPRRVQSTSTNATINPELGREWTKNALSEHASVASFAAFNIALMTNHAPSDLVEDSLRAALDEVRHARVSFEIASALVGGDVGPGPLPLSSHQFEKNLTALATSVAKEGCVDETLSALVAAAEVELIDEILETGSVPVSKYAGVSRDTLAWIRDELRPISIDESRHSLLAWRTLHWVCTVDDVACDDAKTNVLTELKLTAAFKRFGQRFEGHPQLQSHMRNAWMEIQTSWLSRLNADGTTVEAPACSADAIGGLARDVPDKPPLLALVAENVASGLSQMNEE
ncbi:hypothetical protein ACHAXT_002799 [Thalassiosira profunda]